MTAPGASWEVTCARCGKRRWIYDASGPPTEAYTCLRCQAALAGRNVIDPRDAPTEAEQRARERVKMRFQTGKQPRSPLG